jgi:hypothetical protein
VLSSVPEAGPGHRTLARKHEEFSGEVPDLDSDFAADVEEIARDRKP